MHTMVVRMSLDPTQEAAVVRHFEEDVAPWAKSQPGFVSGQWLRSADGAEGMGVVVFDSAENADAAAEGPRGYARPSGDPATPPDRRAWIIEAVTVFHQVRSA